MRESRYQSILNQYLRDQRKEKFYCYVELKVARGNTFAFSKIEDSQKRGLPALEREGMVWKFSDEDTREKPCDGGSFPPLPTYLVIVFEDCFYFILYEKIEEMMAAGMKSITQQQAHEESSKVVHIGH